MNFVKNYAKSRNLAALPSTRPYTSSNCPMARSPLSCLNFVLRKYFFGPENSFSKTLLSFRFEQVLTRLLLCNTLRTSRRHPMHT
ncbi:hypothetical protein HKD37_02G003834 [Glycine soja]